MENGAGAEANEWPDAENAGEVVKNEHRTFEKEDCFMEKADAQAR